MKPLVSLATAAVLAAACGCAVAVRADVVVLANRTPQKVEFSLVLAGGSEQRQQIASGDVVPVFMADRIGIAFSSSGKPVRYLLRANSIYCFSTRNEQLDLVHVTLPAEPPGASAATGGTGTAGRPTTPAASTTGPTNAAVVIPVKILVDQYEPAVQRIWEQRLRERVAEASKIFEHGCRIRFEVVAVGTWESDGSRVNFPDAMRDFESKVTAAPARVALGFTSLYQIPRGRTHMGGTRGPLHLHILIREWSQHVSRSERVEILVHELGHFLGAVHCPEPDSVMRPAVGDRRSNALAFRIGFDPINTLILCLVGEQLRSGGVRGFDEFPPATKAALRSAYRALAQAMPDDSTARQSLQLLDSPSYTVPGPLYYPRPLVEGTQVVVRAIAEAARQNAALPAPAAATAGRAARLSGDRLTEFYVRRAAAAAATLPPEAGAKAFLLGLGIALDEGTLLRNTPILGELGRLVESETQRRQRLAVLGSPTMAGRRDLAQHFFLSGVLTVLAGGQLAETAGIVKELDDARRGTGFSFADLAADMAGVAFAAAVLDKKIPLASLSAGFAVTSFLPDVQKLPEGITWQDFVAKLGSAEDERFYQQKRAIRQRILALPGHKG